MIASSVGSTVEASSAPSVPACLVPVDSVMSSPRGTRRWVEHDATTRSVYKVAKRARSVDQVPRSTLGEAGQVLRLRREQVRRPPVRRARWPRPPARSRRQVPTTRPSASTVAGIIPPPGENSAGRRASEMIERPVPPAEQVLVEGRQQRERAPSAGRGGAAPGPPQWTAGVLDLGQLVGDRRPGRPGLAQRQAGPGREVLGSGRARAPAGSGGPVRPARGPGRAAAAVRGRASRRRARRSGGWTGPARARPCPGPRPSSEHVDDPLALGPHAEPGQPLRRPRPWSADPDRPAPARRPGPDPPASPRRPPAAAAVRNGSVVTHASSSGRSSAAMRCSVPRGPPRPYHRTVLPRGRPRRRRSARASAPAGPAARPRCPGPARPAAARPDRPRPGGAPVGAAAARRPGSAAPRRR